MKQEQGDQILQILVDMKQHQEATDKILLDMKQHQEATDKILLDMKQHQEATDKTLADIKEELTRVGNTVTRIEYEHGRKLDILFDAVTGNTQKLEEHENRFEKNEKILDKHSDEIYYLTTRLEA